MPSIIYRDELPEGCPPGQAEIIRSNRVVFHFVEDDPMKDFQSQRTMFPSREFPGADECIARGVSVFETKEAAQTFLKAMKRRRRWTNKRICHVDLADGAGAMLKTHRGQPAEDGQHWTWWPAKSFDIVAHVHEI